MKVSGAFGAFLMIAPVFAVTPAGKPISDKTCLKRMPRMSVKECNNQPCTVEAYSGDVDGLYANAYRSCYTPADVDCTQFKGLGLGKCIFNQCSFVSYNTEGGKSRSGECLNELPKGLKLQPPKAMLPGG